MRGNTTYQFVALTLLVMCANMPAQAAPAGAVTEAQGRAAAQRQGNEVVLATGAGVDVGDELSTGPGAKLAITLNDGGRLSLGPNGDLVIDDLVYAPQGSSHMALKVAAGAARFVAGAIEKVSGPQAVNITTPVATIGIRGTDFFINLDGSHLSVALFSGIAVTVSNPAGTTVLHPGEGTDVFGASPPTAARPWAPDRINGAVAVTALTPLDRRPMAYTRAPAAAASLSEAITGGVLSADLRLRSEMVDQASKVKSGEATTMRLRLSYETAALAGFYAGVSGETTHPLDRTVRNDGVNGRTTLPLIPDPSADQLHEAYVGWVDPGDDGTARARIVAGRQRILYDNERWVGPSEFRQNAQSFDAISAEARVLPDVSLRYAYVSRINRVLGNNPGGHWDSDSHFIGAATSLVPFGLTTAYAYLLDLKPVPQFSSATYGLRYEGLARLASFPSGDLAAVLELEGARQSNYAANPQRYTVSYGLVQPGLTWYRTSLYAGYEYLEGNGRAAVQTPLATLHRQNGWADLFTVTPANGLRDFHVRWLQEFPDAGPFKGPKLDVRFLDFASTTGNLHYGSEWDADLNTSVAGLFTLGLRAARYSADRFDADTTKVWTYIEVRF